MKFICLSANNHISMAVGCIAMNNTSLLERTNIFGNPYHELMNHYGKA